jgi:hypothetical protein
MTTHPTLICEGSCNPLIDQIDNAVRVLRKGYRQADGSSFFPVRGPLPDGRVLAQVKALKHTPHTRVSPGTCACDVCKTERRY